MVRNTPSHVWSWWFVSRVLRIALLSFSCLNECDWSLIRSKEWTWWCWSTRDRTELAVLKTENSFPGNKQGCTVWESGCIFHSIKFKNFDVANNFFQECRTKIVPKLWKHFVIEKGIALHYTHVHPDPTFCKYKYLVWVATPLQIFCNPLSKIYFSVSFYAHLLGDASLNSCSGYSIQEWHSSFWCDIVRYLSKCSFFLW